MAFRPLRVALGAGDDHERCREVAARFLERFGRAPEGLARAPGRVNLIGEHIDYEGYAVLPMAIQQDVCVAFAVVAAHADGGGDGDGGLRLRAELTSADTDKYPAVEVHLATGAAPELLSGQEAWANYAVCGFLAARDLLARALAASDAQAGVVLELQVLVDGKIPLACGLSSSSALVVAAATATAYAIARCGVASFAMPSRVEMAQACRLAERHVGTLGGGMDQAISCLGQRGHALYITFKPELRAQPVQIGGVDPTVGAESDETAGYSFVVANSGVVAEKAVDATTRFNKRVVECALAAKFIGKKLGISGWEQVERLADLQERLGQERGQAVSPRELQELALDCCPLSEYSLDEIEGDNGLAERLATLFQASDIRAGVERVLAAASKTTTYLLQQRARHVWAEAERVERFKALCSSLSSDSALDDKAHASTYADLGRLMLDSHRSCQLLYECSCDELDSLVATAMEHGALGARLTGAGWGGCVVVLAPNQQVPVIMEKLRATMGLQPGERQDAVFKSEPAAGADIFSLEG